MQTSLRADGLGFSYDGERRIFSAVTFALGPGFCGLVGENGAGKSTLLSLLAGQLLPTEGRRCCEPPELVPVLCPQRVAETNPQILLLAAAWDRVAVRIRQRMGIVVEDVERWETLSPGERKRWQIASALYAEPEVLLLDEPTNHLDLEGRQRLVSALKAFRGIGVIVSHDRRFLDLLTSRTLRLWGGGARLYEGNYSAAVEAWTRESQATAKARTALRRRAQHLSSRLETERQRTVQADKGISARTRIKGPRDSDGREALRKGRALNAAGSIAQKVGETKQLIEQNAALLQTTRTHKERGGALLVDCATFGSNQVVRLVADRICAGENTLLTDVSLVVGRTDRVHLAGPNGSGKTSLLQAIHHQYLKSGASRPVLFLQQEISHEAEAVLLHSIEQMEQPNRQRVYDALAAQGLKPTEVLSAAHRSPGEMRKIAIAHGIATEVAAMLLDEPTNHLDLLSIERLEALLGSYPGAIVLVCHDAAFADALTDQSWTIKRQHLIFAGAG